MEVHHWLINQTVKIGALFYAFLLNNVSMQNDNPIDGTNCRKQEVVVS